MINNDSNKIKKNGGVMTRIGKRFSEAVEEIIDKKLLNGTAKERVSIEKITNLIVRCNMWPEIEKKIIEANEEEVKRYGKG